MGRLQRRADLREAANTDIRRTSRAYYVGFSIEAAMRYVKGIGSSGQTKGAFRAEQDW